MLTIIEIKDREDGGHGLQSQSHRTECWLEGWLAVPPELEQTAWDCAGYCDLDIQDGKLVGLTPREQPPKPEPEPDLTPQFRTAMPWTCRICFPPGRRYWQTARSCLRGGSSTTAASSTGWCRR